MSFELPTWLPRGRHAWLLVLAVALALFTSFCCYTGFYGGDDIYYFSAARELAGDGNSAHSMRSLNELAFVRLGLHLPNALLYLLTDGDIKLIAWAQIGYHVGLVIVAYALGRIVDDQTSATATALLVATFPIFYLYSGAVLPDVPLAFWLGCVLVVLEVLRKHRGGSTLARSSSVALYVAAGIGLGLAYTVKETALVMTVPAAVHVMVNSGRLRDLQWLRNGLYMATGLLAVIALETLVLKMTTGEWVLRAGLSSEVQEGFARRIEQQGSGPFERIEYAASKRLLGVIPIGFWVMLVAGCAYPFLRKRSWGLLAFFWWPALYLTIGSTSLTRYLPPSIQTRYYSVIALPALLMAVLCTRFALERIARIERFPAAIPSWLPGSLTVLLAAWGVQFEFRNSLIQPGAFVKASYARAFSQAYDDAREQFPSYPIVLSDFYQQRMAPLLFPKAPSGVLAHPSVSEQFLPKPPFVYLAPASEIEDSKSRARIANRFGGEGTCMEILEVFKPPKGRDEVLERAFGHLLERSTASEIQYLDRAAAAMAMVLPNSTNGCPIEDVEMLSLDEGVVVSGTESGHLAAWSSSDAFYLRLFDARPYRRVPIHPQAKLITPSSTIVGEFELRAFSAKEAAVLAHLYAYDGDGNLISKSYESTSVSPDGTPTIMRIEVSADAKITHYRATLKVRPKAQTGRIFVHPIRVSVPERSKPDAPIDATAPSTVPQ